MTQDLIARLEAASGCSRELDQDIWEIAVGGREPTSQIYPHCPKFTASIDDALRLVPEGWDWCLSKGADEAAVAALAPATFVSEVVVDAATPALALCIAALKARAA